MGSSLCCPNYPNCNCPKEKTPAEQESDTTASYIFTELYHKEPQKTILELQNNGEQK